VIERASYRHPTLQKWEFPDSIDVYLEGRTLIRNRSKLQASGVYPKLLLNGGVDCFFVVTSHSAVGVRHNKHTTYTQQLRSQHQGSQYVIGHPRTGISQNLRISCLHTNNGKRIDA
jgi:hypothetical protein